jgi:hypothetical protein
MIRRRKFVAFAMIGLLSAAAMAVGTGAMAQAESSDSAAMAPQMGGSGNPYYPPLMRPEPPAGIWESEFTAWPFSFRYGYGPGHGYRPWYRVWYGEGHPYGYRTWYGYGMPYFAYYPRPYLATLDRARGASSATLVYELGPGEGAPTPEDVVRRIRAAWEEGSDAPLMPLLSRDALVGVTVAGRPAASITLSQNEFLERLHSAFSAVRTTDVQVAGLLPRGSDRLEATTIHEYRTTGDATLASQVDRDSSATLTVTTTRRGGRWYLTALQVPPGYPLLATPTVIASR